MEIAATKTTMKIVVTKTTEMKTTTRTITTAKTTVTVRTTTAAAAKTRGTHKKMRTLRLHLEGNGAVRPAQTRIVKPKLKHLATSGTLTFPLPTTAILRIGNIGQEMPTRDWMAPFPVDMDSRQTSMTPRMTLIHLQIQRRLCTLAATTTQTTTTAISHMVTLLVIAILAVLNGPGLRTTEDTKRSRATRHFIETTWPSQASRWYATVSPRLAESSPRSGHRRCHLSATKVVCPSKQ
mmetsp:Transcript_22989/g.38007  ORF Transcript_22989/g.38007 Transcript_22989/m.38007 type:complete len:237 (-) Transcript_22989:161-871(-)